MEGGCKTGEMAAIQILRSLGLKKTAAQQQAYAIANQWRTQNILHNTWFEKGME
jgi:hypothetical protein